MSFDKTKAMRSAERYLSQGKIRAAIGEYKQIAENDPRDYSTLNILGDLYVKNAEKAQAITCFTRVAEYYSKQGFAQKAIAIYNKISRLQPDSVEISAKLAELYQIKGSFAEARSHYLILAEQYERTGKKMEALSIWKQIAELDPKNIEVYLKIAEAYLKEAQMDEAVDAFTAAGERLSAQNRFDSALEAFARALEIRENDFKALNGYVKAQISIGDTDEAAKTLEKILETQPSNRDILYLLVDCHLDTNNPQAAEKSVIKLVEQEPANYPKFLELVAAYLRENDLPAAARILSMSSEHLLVGGQSEEFLTWTNEILARNPEQLEALHLLVRYYSWQRDDSELQQALKSLAEGARLAGSIDDERYALSQLVLMVPHETSFASRLQEIHSQHGLGENSYEPVVTAPVSQENYVYETPEFESFAPVSYEETNAEASRFAADGFGEYQVDFAAPNTFNDGAKDFVFSGDTFDAKIVEEFNGDEYAGFGKTDELFEESFDLAPEAAGANELSVSDELKLEKELESIEFYFEQGYKELAEKSLLALEEEYGSQPQITTFRERMSDSAPPFAETEEPLFNLGETAPPPVAEENYAEQSSLILPNPELETNGAGSSSSNGAAIANNFDFISDFRNDLGFEETVSAKDDDDYETHYHLAIAYKEMGLTEESIREFQDAINLVSPNDGTRRFFACAHLLGHCFMEKNMPNLALMWYKRALETSDLSVEEKQGIWYEIGNAYEVGGDCEKAMENFGMIYAVNVDYRDVSERIQTLHVNI
ncbi:MAG: hypothetical protein JWN60_452 [Acidobacteria bacterium]|jgi:tetratricopeptide (TPR) repeat protein|nr:hypothetical protein [Acidobacteriota bacterium]